MTPSDPERVAIRFVNEINRHDVSAISSMMSADFRFVDSLGHEVRGVEQMRAGWVAYFDQFPDYHIAIQTHVGVGQVVALFGTASGTLAEGHGLLRESHWNIPAAWRVVVRDGRVVDWQVYADNTPVHRLLGSRK
jgi:ketosteroid isomerase-like protein